MKKMMTLLFCGSLLLVLSALNDAQAGPRGINSALSTLSVNDYTNDVVDIYDIFAKSLKEVELWDEDIQFFVDRLDPGARVFQQTKPDGTRIYTFMTSSDFGCIAKILPAVPGVKPELYMHIENCTIPRQCKSGKAITNYIRNTIHKADGTMVKAFNSTATWTFHHVDDMVVTTPAGMQFSDLWLVETLVVNTPGPSMVQYFTVEGVGIVGKRAATVSW